MVGEVRGGEALDLLKAWNTGHPGGIATIHADSARQGLDRLEQCVSEATATPNRAHRQWHPCGGVYDSNARG
uniref:Conjugative transfer protein TrbB n=1 Tax=Vibrio parahaemolyticus TaxID=670 RepID=A0A1Y1B9Y5_VIBPH|nr:conjugative transfer protein TrbB [Vibrio parahaemolyticus]